MADDRLKVAVDIREAIRNLEALEAEFKRSAQDMDKAADQVDFDGATEGADDLEAGVGGAAAAMSNLALVAAATAAAAVVAFKGWQSVVETGVEAFRTQEAAVAQLNAALKSTGETAGFSSEQLQQMAADLQGLTTFGDEDIIRMQSQLLTFTNITGEAFARTEEAVLNLSARMDQDLQTSVLQLGKALNDPVANLGALSRAGIQFSETQEKLIKDLAKSGDLLGAQTIILEELETQFGGAAAAARDTMGGAIDALGNQVGDLQEKIGEGLAPALIEAIDEISTALLGLGDDAKTLGEVVGIPFKLMAEDIRRLTAIIEVLKAKTLPDLIQAFRELNAELEDGLEGFQKTEEQMEAVRVKMRAAQAAAEDQTEATEAQTAATEEAADEFIGYEEAVGGATEAVEDLASAEDAAAKKRQEGIDAATAAAEAAHGMVEAQNRLNEILGQGVIQEEEAIDTRKELTRETRELTKAERELERARNAAAGLEDEVGDLQQTIEELTELQNKRGLRIDQYKELEDAQDKLAKKQFELNRAISEEEGAQKTANAERERTAASIKDQVDDLLELIERYEKLKEGVDDLAESYLTATKEAQVFFDMNEERWPVLHGLQQTAIDLMEKLAD
jgi:hypothetical protein